ncbi:hypothetical protein CsatB_007315 [Cannabis sativa]|uniref:Cytochrome P450 n=1 Tax=Cannabis sativa TaxID=3483 RepID=A0A7J6G706_CANSA|nr:hypothetical protein F8388_001281 [Cannabis sativa]
MIMFLSWIVFIAIYAFTNNFLGKIKNLPPSPFPVLPIIGHLYLIIKKPLVHRALSKISDRYGPVLLLKFGSRPVLLVSSPSAAEECLAKNDVVFANRPRLLAGKHLGYNYTSLVWASYGDHWRNLRRISSNEILSSHRLQMLSHIRSEEVSSLIRRLVRSAQQDPRVEIKSLLFELMLNIMMRMIAGKRYYGDNNVEMVDEEAHKFQEIVRETLRLGGTTNVSDFLPLFRSVLSRKYEKGLIEVQKKRDSFMQSLIDENRTSIALAASRQTSLPKDHKKKNMIEVLLSLQESDPEYYTDEIIRGLMLALLSAGTDTTAGIMEWAMSLMLNHPEVLKKARNELEYCIGHDRLVEESDLGKLPYLHRIIKETLRLYPVGALLPHESSEECIIGGYRVPRGTMLLVNLWAIQHDPKVWDEPTKFKPDRFEEGDQGVREGFKLVPFGSGRRGCPGETLAMRMVALTLASLIQCFDWEMVDHEAKIDMTEKLGLSLSKAHSSLLNCRPRPTMSNILSHI